MARDPGLEELVHMALGARTGLVEKAMFGGWAFLLRGNFLCGVRTESLLLRVGRDQEPWALALEGVEPAMMGSRRMHGYVRATPAAYADDRLRQQLLDRAIDFVLSLPPKQTLARKAKRAR